MSDTITARQKARRLWRKTLLERAAAGESREGLAQAEEVSLSTVQRALTRAQAERPVLTYKQFAARQYDRVEKAVALAEARIAEGDVAAAYAMIRLLPLLQRFHDQL